MREILKKSYFGVIDLMKTIMSLFMVLLYSSRKGTETINKLRETGKEKDAYVLANGPALKGVIEKYLPVLQKNDCIVMNFFGNTDAFWLVKPRYYVLLDPGFFGGELHAVFNNRFEKLVNNITKVDWKMALLIPATNKINITNPNIEVIPFNATRVEGFKSFRNFMYKHNLGLPSTKNVLFPAIISMLNMGYGHVYLYGAEFSWVKTYNVDEENGKIYTDDVHFYGKDRIYYERGRFCFDIGCLHEALLSTYVIQEYADSIGRKVINRTKGSFIDAFDYENPDRIIISSKEL